MSNPGNLSRLHVAAADVNDTRALAELFAPIFGGEEIRRKFRSAPQWEGRCATYEKESRTARFLMGDGTRIVCFSVDNVSSTQGAMIAAQWDFENVSESSAHDFAAAVDSVLGGEFISVH